MLSQSRIFKNNRFRKNWSRRSLFLIKGNAYKQIDGQKLYGSLYINL